MIIVNKIFSTGIALLVINMFATFPFSLAASSTPNHLVKVSCQEDSAESFKFKQTGTHWGVYPDGEGFAWETYQTSDGERVRVSSSQFSTESRFREYLRYVDNDLPDVIERSPLFDEKGLKIGQRIVQGINEQAKAQGLYTLASIIRITGRKVEGISGSSLELVLAFEKERRRQSMPVSSRK